MFKMGSHDPFEYLQHNGQKKGQKSKCQFDFWPLKVKNHIELHACRWHATYHWKPFDKGYNFALNLTSIKGLHKKLWVFKMARILIPKILAFPTWECQEKWHLGPTPMVSHKEYYKREGDGFPQVWVVMSIVNTCMIAIHPCTKSAPTMP